MKKAALLLFVCLSCSLLSLAQRHKPKGEDGLMKNPPFAQPKLVVGIVVDQMRYDYISRFWNHYGDNGFKRLVSGGFLGKNHHFNYAPTTTAPGHASVYTGTTPATHGIIGNNWYDKELGREVYCVSFDTISDVGTDSGAGRMAPYRLLTTTITDQLRLHTQFRGKTIAVALKDRGAVLPGGHTANAAYWFEGKKTGNWISSSYYMQSLPQWVVNFNASDAVEQYKKPWTTLKSIETYLESGLDEVPYEGLFKGETTSTFPHDIPALWEQNGHYDILRTTAYGNSMTTDFAIEALKQEGLGKDEHPDFLAISYSSTDYVGHQFGVNSKEIQDTYVRLDKEMERLLNLLDNQVGINQYTLFLTADHGAIHVPNFLKEHNMPADYLDTKAWNNKLNAFLEYTYGTKEVVKTMSNFQIFLDDEVLRNLDLEWDDVQEEIATEINTYNGVGEVFTAEQLKNWVAQYPAQLPDRIRNGWHPQRSGEVVIVQKPGWIAYPPTGSTHGSPMMYDTHVPLIFYGTGVKKGQSLGYTSIADVAPTLAAILGIAFPNGCTGEVIEEVIAD